MPNASTREQLDIFYSLVSFDDAKESLFVKSIPRKDASNDIVSEIRGKTAYVLCLRTREENVIEVPYLFSELWGVSGTELMNVAWENSLL